jgi:hypothetical protein
MVAQLYTEPNKALEFLEKVLLARNRLGTEASLCLDMDVVIVKLKLGQTKDAKEALEAAKEKTQSLQSKEPVIFSRFFMATAEYRKVSVFFSCAYFVTRNIIVCLFRDFYCCDFND